MDLGGNPSFHVVPLQSVVSTHESMLGMIYENHVAALPFEKRTGIYRFDHSDLETLERFQYRTVNTIGSQEVSGILKNEFVRYACKVGDQLLASHLTIQDPALMHALLAITLAHDRYEISPFTPPAAREMYHMNYAIQAISIAINRPASRTVSETIWATATIMGAVSFCTLEGKCPEDFWPMKETDLAWLRMSEGKALMHKMMSSSDRDSPANKLAEIHHAVALVSSLQYEQLAVLPARFLKIFGISQNADTNNNPYYTAICYLAQLWPLEADRSNILQFMNFITRMDPSFRRVMLAKDPRALLAMAWWWRMVSRFQLWWHGTRARLECQAVCLYLTKYHGHEWYIQEFLPFAQTGCGLLGSESLSDDTEEPGAPSVPSVSLV